MIGMMRQIIREQYIGATIVPVTSLSFTINKKNRYL